MSNSYTSAVVNTPTPLSNGRLSANKPYEVPCYYANEQRDDGNDGLVGRLRARRTHHHLPPATTGIRITTFEQAYGLRAKRKAWSCVTRPCRREGVCLRLGSL